MRKFVVGLLLLCSLLIPSFSEAARLFTSGCEEGGSANTDMTTSVWFGAAANASPSTTNPHSGTYSCRVTTTSGKNFTARIGTSKTAGTLTSSWYWRTDSLPGTSSKIMDARSGGGVIGPTVTILSTGVIRLGNSAPVSPTSIDSTFTVSTNTYYRFELEHLLDDTAGHLTLKVFVGDTTSSSAELTLNGSGSGEDTLPSNIRDFLFEEASGGTMTYYFDDIRINDEVNNGDGQTSWPGPGKIALLTPSADTSATWTKGGSAPAATNWQGVDDLPGTVNDGTDFNGDSGSSNVEQLALTDLPAEVPSDATMKIFAVYGRIAAGAASPSGTFQYKAWNESGSPGSGPTITVSGTTWRITTALEQFSVGLSGKTKADINSWSAGYGALSGAVEKRVSALWVNVEWIEAAGSSVNFFQRRLQQ